MKKTTIIVLVILVVVIASYFVSAYNGLVTLNESVDNKWAQVESQYQRRLDLIPNLVASVQGDMTQEQEVFTKLADARSKYAGSVTQSDKAIAAGEVESSLARLLVVMENYPVLKTSEAVQTLMAQLEGTENRISVERQRYNDEVRIFNAKIKVIPTKWVAGILGFSTRQYFDAQAGAENAPQVEFNK